MLKRALLRNGGSRPRYALTPEGAASTTTAKTKAFYINSLTQETHDDRAVIYLILILYHPHTYGNCYTDLDLGPRSSRNLEHGAEA